jgi:tripartite-type tricarboxylate transporter receptor subunit TctC
MMSWRKHGSRRFAIVAAGLAITLTAALGKHEAAHAQAAALKVVVPFGPGTTTDIVARHVGDAMAAARRSSAAPTRSDVAAKRPD